MFATLLRSPAVIGTFALPTYSEPALGLSPDGRTLAVGDFFGTDVSFGHLRFYDTRTHGEERPPLSDFVGGSPMYSRDGSRIMYLADEHGVFEVMLRDAHTLVPLASVPIGEDFPIGNLVLAPDSGSVYYAYRVTPTTTDLGRWSLRSLRPLSSRPIGSAIPSALRLVDGGKRLLVASGHTISLFDARSLRLLRSTSLTIGPGAAVISPDGRTVVSASQTSSVSFIDASSGKVRLGRSGHGAPLASIVYSPNGRTVVTVGDDGKAIVWDPRTATPSAVLTGPPGQIVDTAISPDGTTLYTSALGGVLLQWDLAGDRRFGQRSTLGASSTCCGSLAPSTPPLARSPDGSQFAVRLSASRVGLFSAYTLSRERSFTIRPRNAVITALAWSPHAPELAVAGYSGVVQLWNVDGVPRLVRSLVGLEPRLPGLREAVQEVAFSPNGQTLAASDNTSVRHWVWGAGGESGTLARDQREADRPDTRAPPNFRQLCSRLPR